MADMYRNNMALGLPYSASVGTGPLPTVRKSAESRNARFHPYTVSSSYNQRNLQPIHSAPVDLPEFSAPDFAFGATQPARYLPDCQLSGAGALLASALCYPDFIPFHAGSQVISFPQTFDLKTLQNLCSRDAQTVTSFSNATSPVEKDCHRRHPFYWRKRVEPAEGMTRTRDKYRVVYTEKQRSGLENEYKTNKFITTERKAEISRELDLSERQIKIWFQNRRAKERRGSRKRKDAEQNDLEKCSEDDNNMNDRFPDCLTHANYPTSCRFADRSTQIEEKTFSSGQCQYMNQSQSECITTNRFNSSKPCVIGSRDFGMSRYPVSPSEWSASTNSTFIPAMNVSPITGNDNTDFAPRL